MTKTIRIAVALLAIMVAGTAAQADGPLTLVTSLPLGTRAHDLVLGERDGRKLAYVATDLGLSIVDITTPASPFVRGSVKLGGKAMGIAVQGDYAYVATFGPDFKVVNVANPAAPVLVATRPVVGYTWDVAVKDNVAYLASWSGEFYLFDITNPAAPVQFRIIGLPAWTTSNDGPNLTKLKTYVNAGNAKVSGLWVTGNRLSTVDYNYGRLYEYDVTDATNPIFLGTHYVPFTFRGATDLERGYTYVISPFGNASSVDRVPLLKDQLATRHTSCGQCGEFIIGASDYGGIAVSPNGRFVVHISGKRGVVQVLNVANPPGITNAGSLSIPAHGLKTAESMGVEILGNHIFTAAGTIGVQVLLFPGLSDAP